MSAPFLALQRIGATAQDLSEPLLDLRKINQDIIRHCLPSKLILDLDSTVETVYGDQSGAAKGTNPHKPGRKGYHPLLAFEGQSRLCLNAVLRAKIRTPPRTVPPSEQTFYPHRRVSDEVRQIR